MAPPIRPIKDRILERVKHNERGCWLWQGSIFKDGYGAIGIRRTGSKRAHRVSYEAFVGRIPDGLWVLHKCDTPACVNPDHLFVGTASDNTVDMHNKGRRKILRGEDHPNTKFSERFVWGVRKLHDKPGLSIRVLSDMYGINYFTMYQLAKRKTRRVVNEEKCAADFRAEWIAK